MDKPWYIELKSQKEFDLFLKWAVNKSILGKEHLNVSARSIPYYCYFNPKSNIASYNTTNIYKSNSYEYAIEISIEDFKSIYLDESYYYEIY